MPECHHCPHHMKKHIDCLTCPGFSDAGVGHGRPVDVGSPDILDVMAAAMRSQTPDSDPNLDATLDMFRRLLECDEDTMRLLRWRFMYPQQPLYEYAREQGVSARTVARRIKAIAATWPAAGRLLGVTSHG
jgi:hypothetical protein